MGAINCKETPRQKMIGMMYLFLTAMLALNVSKDILDEIQLKERIKMPFTKLDIYFAPLEGNIAFKEDWLKSDKDMEDAKHLRIVYQGEFDEERINKFKRLIKEVRLKNAR